MAPHSNRRPPRPTATDEAAAAGGDAVTADARIRSLQQRRAAARACSTLADALGADRAEEVDPLLQRRHDAKRRATTRSSCAPPSTQRRAGEHVDLSGRHARPAGDRSRRRRVAGRAREAVERVLRSWRRRSSSTQLARLAGDVARRSRPIPAARAFIDTNDFGEAFAQVQRDTSRVLPARLQQHERRRRTDASAASRVRVKKPGLRVEHRAGYYAERDFAHTNRAGPRASAAGTARLRRSLRPTCPWWCRRAGSGWRPDRYYVPVSVAVPGRLHCASRRSDDDARRARRSCATNRAGRWAVSARRSNLRRTASGVAAQAGALPDGLHAAARPLRGEGRRARERERHRWARSRRGVVRARPAGRRR